MDLIFDLAKRHKIPVVEDAAHSLGSVYKGRNIGTLGKATVFSFGPIKAITTGMGGMITTSDRNLDQRLRILRSYGMNRSAWSRRHSKRPWRYQVDELGHNFRMTEISAALGLAQLEKLDRFLEKRRRLATYLTDNLSMISGIHPPVVPPGYDHTYLYYVIRVDRKAYGITRDLLAQELMAKGVAVSVHWDPPLHLHNIFQRFGYKRGSFKVTERLSKELITLPLHPGLRREDMDFMIDIIRKCHRVR